MVQAKEPSFRERVISTLAASEKPLALDELAEQLLPGTPRKRALSKLRTAVGSDNIYVVRVAENTYDTVEKQMLGSRFRYRVSPTELAGGLLHIADDLDFLFRPFSERERGNFQEAHLALIDDEGQELEVETIVTRGPSPPHITETYMRRIMYRLIEGLDDLYDAYGLTSSDDLIITVESIRPPRYRLSVEKARSRDDAQVAAADERMLQACTDLLKYTGQASADALMRRLVGVWDAPGEVPHLPMFLLPRDSRYLYFFHSYYQPDHPRVQIPYYQENIVLEEMETLLEGVTAHDDTVETQAAMARQLLEELLPPGMVDDGKLDSVIGDVLNEHRDLFARSAGAASLMRRMCFERMRIMRGLWPDEPDLESAEQWLNMIQNNR